MARTSLATASYDTPQKGFRDYSPIQYIVIHHAATESLQAVIDLEMGARQVSSTLIIKDDQIVSMMDEQWRAWSLSSNWFDSISLSVETCNSGGAAEGWPISEASYRSLAKVVADWCRRYSIPCNRERVLGHREVYLRYGVSYATACPGGIDLDRVVADANEILTGTSATQGDITMRIIYRNDGNATPDERKRKIVGELTYQVITGPQAVREEKLWGKPINFTPGEDDAARDLVIARRKELGLPVVITGNGSVGGDWATRADAQAIRQDIANLPKPPTTFKAV